MPSPAPWTSVPSPPARPLKDIMDETLAQELHDQEINVSLPIEAQSESANPIENKEVEMDSDYALALALQNEEQQSAYTVDYSRLATMGSDAVIDDDVDEPQLRHKDRPKRRDTRAVKHSTKHSPKKSSKAHNSPSDAFVATATTHPLLLMTGSEKDIASVLEFIAEKTTSIQIATVKDQRMNPLNNGHDLLIHYHASDDESNDATWTPLKSLVHSSV
ncbi:hypothetical protein THRCLA_22304 [Thraustotheca clavata]|uniref:Uncharacterized protein n=1 Tax=Thraustotheca clavata TaxID=74557 RepID=A0A1V9Z6J0_9STRA|nr:hypothetical protein THRCLA_22304 [Thraustotheca clavata]